MNTFTKLCFISSLCVIFYDMNAQYITLRGKQFYNQSGQPFYPVTCNYEMRFSCYICGCGYGGSNCDSSDYQLEPSYNYGSTNNYEHPFAYGIDKIRADFVKMKQMGFNTVRVMTLYNNINKHYLYDSIHDQVLVDTSQRGGRIICLQYGNAYNDGAGWWGHWFVIDTPYATNHNFQKIYLPKIKQLLDTAASVGINVIFVTGGSSVSAAGDVTAKKYNYQENPYNDAQAIYYANYLKALVSNLKTKTALFAYDLYNEPEWGDDTWNPSGGHWGPSVTKIKNEICQYTAMWYDSIKANDPNHLVTIASGDVFSVFNYDPAIMKLDFNCYHIYPPFFYRAYNNYNRQNILGVFNTELHWANRVNPLPWMLEETGAIAWTAKGHDTLAQHTNNLIPTYTTYAPLVGVNLSKPPYADVWGNFDDQDTFALWSQQAVLNNSGSGYAWWEFQDESKQKPYTDTVPPVGGFIGLLKPGDPNGSNPYVYDTTLDKPVVSFAFRNNTPTAPTAPYAMPANYYNPFGGTYFNYHGRVVDQNGQPIRDAVVQGYNAWNHHAPPNLWVANNPTIYPTPREGAFEIFTFTREDGTFDLTAPVQRPPDSAQYYPYNYGRFDAIQVSAPAASKYEWYDNTTYGVVPSDTLIHLYRQAGVFDDTVNVHLTAPNNQTYTARHILIVQNVTIDSGATADFHATTEVDLLSGFDSKRGSNTVVYIAPVDFDCGTLYDGSEYFKTNDTKELKEEPPQSKNIDVHYAFENYAVRLLPNPASNTVYVEADESGSCSVEITNTAGSTVYNSKFYLSKQATIDVSDFAEGEYNVLVKLNDISETFKLIINH